MQRPKRAFALRDLLVTIFLVVFVMSLVLPSLGLASGKAGAHCRQNIRSLVRALLMYAEDDPDGHFPPSPGEMNASLTFEIQWPYYHYPSSPRYERERIGLDQENGFLAQGLLHVYGYIEDPEVYYCPDIEEGPFSWPQGWDDNFHGYRFSSYMYRMFGQEGRNSSPPITYEMIDELFNIEAGADEVLLADTFMQSFDLPGIPAHTDPFGLNLAFADGHVKWRKLGEDELDRCMYWSTGVSYATRDAFAYLYFRALTSGDFSEIDEYFPAP